MKKNLILFLILLCNCTFLYAQQFNITGVVTDKKLKEPIICQCHCQRNNLWNSDRS